MATFKHLNVTLENKLAHVELNRPEKANALDEALWREIKTAFEWVDATAEARVAVLSGSGKHFCAGIDLNLLGQMAQRVANKDEARKCEEVRRLVLEFQQIFTTIERCRKPVLAAIHSGCFGAGLDMVCACDMRYTTEDAFFVIQEINLGITADVGTLQRLPKLIPDGVARELAFTGRKFLADEARHTGFVNSTFASKEALMGRVMAIAGEIAAKSPLAVRGSKEMLLYTRDHSVQDSLNHVATWNSGMLFSADAREAMMAKLQKRDPVFED